MRSGGSPPLDHDARTRCRSRRGNHGAWSIASKPRRGRVGGWALKGTWQPPRARLMRLRCSAPPCGQSSSRRRASFRWCWLRPRSNSLASPTRPECAVTPSTPADLAAAAKRRPIDWPFNPRKTSAVGEALAGRSAVSPAMRLHKQLDQQLIEFLVARDDAFVATARRFPGFTQLQTVQGARTGQGVASVALSHPLGRGGGMHLQVADDLLNLRRGLANARRGFPLLRKLT